jgi:membrane protease YdiL (CAAX protease family)
MTADAAPSPLSERGRLAEHLRGFDTIGLMGFVAIAAGALVTPPVGAMLVLGWMWLSRTPAREIGLARPASWIGGIVLGLVIGLVLSIAMKALVMPLLGASPVSLSYQFVAHDNGAALDQAAYAVYGAGFAEELVFRGFLFERLRKLLGESAAAAGATLLLSTVLFALTRWQQGWTGIAGAACIGLVFGIVYLAAGRRLFVPAIAHAAFALSGLAMIVYGLETQISHLVFK